MLQLYPFYVIHGVYYKCNVFKNSSTGGLLYYSCNVALNKARAIHLYK